MNNYKLFIIVKQLLISARVDDQSTAAPRGGDAVEYEFTIADARVALYRDHVTLGNIGVGIRCGEVILLDESTGNQLLRALARDMGKLRNNCIESWRGYCPALVGK